MTRVIHRVEATRVLKVDQGSLRVVQAGGTQTRVVQAATQQGLPGSGLGDAAVRAIIDDELINRGVEQNSSPVDILDFISSLDQGYSNG